VEAFGGDLSLSPGRATNRENLEKCQRTIMFLRLSIF